MLLLWHRRAAVVAGGLAHKALGTHVVHGLALEDALLLTGVPCKVVMAQQALHLVCIGRESGGSLSVGGGSPCLSGLEAQVRLRGAPVVLNSLPDSSSRYILDCRTTGRPPRRLPRSMDPRGEAKPERTAIVTGMAELRGGKSDSGKRADLFQQ